MTLQTDIEHLFDRYLTAWNARDFYTVAACYAYPCLFILPQASLSVGDKAEMLALLEGLFAGLEADGFCHTEIGKISVRACGDTLALVDVTDIRRLRKDGSILEVIDGHYVARFEKDAWFFNTAVVCTPGWQAS